MKKMFIILFITLNYLSINAQIKETEVNTQIGLTDTELQKAIDAYVKMSETDTYKSIKIENNKMIDKLNQDVIPKQIAKDEEWNKWITENLKKTKFISINDANKYRNLNLELMKKQLDENAELYDLIKRATIEQKLQILKPERVGRPF